MYINPKVEGADPTTPPPPLNSLTFSVFFVFLGCKLIADDLKKTLEGLCDALFGPVRYYLYRYRYRYR